MRFFLSLALLLAGFQDTRSTFHAQNVGAGGGGGGFSYSVIDHKITESIVGGTTLSAATASSTAGDSICVGMGSLGHTNTVTAVTDNAAGGSNTYTQVGAGAARASNSTPPDIMSDAWCSLNTANGSATSVTVTWSISTSYRVAEVWQVRRSSGSATIDTEAVTNSGVAVSNTATGPSVVTTGAAGFIGAFIMPVDSITSNPKAGNAFTSGGDIATNGPAGASLITTSSGTYQPVWTDNTVADTFCVSAFALK